MSHPEAPAPAGPLPGAPPPAAPWGGTPAPRPEGLVGLPGDVEAAAGDVMPGRSVRPGRLLLGIAVLGLIGVGVWVLATQTDIWADGYRGRRRAAIHQQRAEARARARARAAAPRYGTLRILGAPAGAAVYVAVGRTPLAAPHLDTGQSHRLLLERSGHVPLRLTVPPSVWRTPFTDGGVAAPDTEEAESAATLRPGPAALVDDEDFAGTGVGSGRTGTLRLRSTPTGASAWQLVGYTPVARIEDLRLDRSFDIMVHKGGYQPARATVPGDAFREGPGGPEHEVTVELRPVVPAGARR